MFKNYLKPHSEIRKTIKQLLYGFYFNHDYTSYSGYKAIKAAIANPVKSLRTE